MTVAGSLDKLSVTVDGVALPDFSVDRVLLVHGLESSEYQRELLREVWRVLTGEGRLLVVAPNRRGIWARLERTPLGWGQPYSTGQLSRLFPTFGGVVAIEAGKQLYAASLQAERKRFRRPIVVSFPRPARPAPSGRAA